MNNSKTTKEKIKMGFYYLRWKDIEKNEMLRAIKNNQNRFMITVCIATDEERFARGFSFCLTDNPFKFTGQYYAKRRVMAILCTPSEHSHNVTKKNIILRPEVKEIFKKCIFRYRNQEINFSSSLSKAEEIYSSEDLFDFETKILKL